MLAGDAFIVFITAYKLAFSFNERSHSTGAKGGRNWGNSTPLPPMELFFIRLLWLLVAVNIRNNEYELRWGEDFFALSTLDYPPLSGTIDKNVGG